MHPIDSWYWKISNHAQWWLALKSRLAERSNHLVVRNPIKSWLVLSKPRLHFLSCGEVLRILPANLGLLREVRLKERGVIIEPLLSGTYFLKLGIELFSTRESITERMLLEIVRLNLPHPKHHLLVNCTMNAVSLFLWIVVQRPDSALLKHICCLSICDFWMKPTMYVGLDSVFANRHHFDGVVDSKGIVYALFVLINSRKRSFCRFASFLNNFSSCYNFLAFEAVLSNVIRDWRRTLLGNFNLRGTIWRYFACTTIFLRIKIIVIFWRDILLQFGVSVYLKSILNWTNTVRALVCQVCASIVFLFFLWNFGWCGGCNESLRK